MNSGTDGAQTMYVKKCKILLKFGHQIHTGSHSGLPRRLTFDFSAGRRSQGSLRRNAKSGPTLPDLTVRRLRYF